MSTTNELLIRIAVEGAGKAAAEVDGVNASLAETEVAAGKAKKGASGLSGAMKGMGVLFAGFTIGAAIKEFSTFQAQMERLKTQTGATQNEVGRASNVILGMATSVGFSPNSLAAALYHIESAGYRGKRAFDALRIAAEGAKIGGADLTDTTTGLTAVMVAGFHGVDTLQKAMGALNATVGAGDMTFQDLNEALGTGILATAKALGLQLKDVGATLAVLGDNNIRGAKAATDLRMALLGLAHPSTAATKELEKLSMAPNQLADDLRKPNGLLRALTDLETHMKGLSPDQRTNLMADITGKKAVGPMLTLMNNLDRLKSKYDAVGKGGNQFNEDWKATTKTLSFFIDQVKALGEVILIKLGGAFQQAGEWIKGFINALEKGKLWAQVIVAIAIAIGSVVLGLKAWAVAQAVVNAVMDIDPILAALSALIVVTALVVMHWKEIVKWVTNAWHWLKDHQWALAILAMVGPVGQVAAGVMFLAMHWKDVKNAAVDAFKWTKQAALDVWNWLKGAWQTVSTIVAAPFKAAASLISSIFDGIKTAIAAVLNWIIDRINNLIDLYNSTIGQLPFAPTIGDVGHVGGSAGAPNQSQFPGVGTTNQSGFMSQPLFSPKHTTRTVIHHAADVPADRGPQVLESHTYLVVDGKVLAKTNVRQGLQALARRGAGGPTIADAG